MAKCKCKKKGTIEKKYCKISEIGKEIQSIVKQLKASHPDMSHRDAMKQAGIIYKQRKAPS